VRPPTVATDLRENMENQLSLHVNVAS